MASRKKERGVKFEASFPHATTHRVFAGARSSRSFFATSAEPSAREKEREKREKETEARGRKQAKGKRKKVSSASGRAHRGARKFFVCKGTRAGSFVACALFFSFPV